MEANRLSLAGSVAVPLFIGLTVIVPFLLLMISFSTPSYIIQIFGNSASAYITRDALANSLEQGSASALLSFAAGLPLGLFFGRYDFRMKKFLTSYSILPFFLPSIVVVFSFMSSFGNSSAITHIVPALSELSRGFTGIIAVNVFFNAPLIMLMTMVAVAGSDPQLEEASASLGAGSLRRFLTTWGRDGMIYGAWGALLAFIYSFAGFTAPLIIGGQKYFTLEAWIYFLARVLDEIGNAAVTGLIEVILLLIPATVYVIFTRSRFTGIAPLRSFARRGSGSTWFLAGALYTALWLLLETYLFSGVLVSSLAPGGRNIFEGFSLLFAPGLINSIGITTAGALLNSLFYGFITAFSATGLGLLWIYSRRRRARTYSVQDLLLFSPLVISSIVLAFSLSAAFSPYVPLDDVWSLIIMAQTVVAIPVVFRIIDAGFQSIPYNVAESSQILGGNSFFEVELPIAHSAISSALLFGFAISLGEFAATNFLASPKFISLTVEIYSLQSIRLFDIANAATALLLIISVALFTLVQTIGEGFVGIR